MPRAATAVILFMFCPLYPAPVLILFLILVGTTCFLSVFISLHAVMSALFQWEVGRRSFSGNWCLPPAGGPGFTGRDETGPGGMGRDDTKRKDVIVILFTSLLR